MVWNYMLDDIRWFSCSLVGLFKLDQKVKSPVEREEVKEGEKGANTAAKKQEIMQNREQDMGGKPSCSRGPRYDIMWV